MPSRPRVPALRWPLIVAIGAAAGGCYEGQDGLTREQIREISQTRGDAEGTVRSGVYGGRVEAIHCGCEDEEVFDLVELSMCNALDRLQQLGIDEPFQVHVNHADGRLRVAAISNPNTFAGYAAPAMYGPLYLDGRAEAAGALLFDAAIIHGDVLIRFEGDLDEEGLRGEVHQRLVLEVEVELEAEEITVRNTDCGESLEVDMQYLGSLPLPVDTGDG